MVPYARLPKEIFVWQNQVRNYDINSYLFDLGPYGVWWDFMQNTSREFVEGTWVVNHGMLTTLMTSYGYLLHDYTPSDLRKAIVLYDRTNAIRERGAGKSIPCDGINQLRPYHWIDGKRLKGDQRFVMQGYTEVKRVVLISDLRKRHCLKFDQVRFKKERVATGRSPGASRRTGGQTYRGGRKTPQGTTTPP